jgi:hypothetical protein
LQVKSEENESLVTLSRKLLHLSGKNRYVVPRKSIYIAYISKGIAMKKFLFSSSVFVLVFALSFAVAGNKKQKSAQVDAKKEKALKSCCMEGAMASKSEDCSDEMKDCSDMSAHTKKVSDKSHPMDKDGKMAMKDGKMDCCKERAAKAEKPTIKAD